MDEMKKPKNKRRLRIVKDGDWERKSQGLKALRKSIQDGTFKKKERGEK
jgi:hypothetical protein